MIGALLVLLLAIAAAYHLSYGLKRTPLAPPTFSLPFCPSFLAGLVAIIRLGADEDGFLRSLQQKYGSVVYLPWPLQQYFVLEAETIDQIYKASPKVLSFLPIRREMQFTVFDALGSWWNDKPTMDGFYRIHSRGLQRSQLEDSLDRFVKTVHREIENFASRLDETSDGQLVVDLNSWITDIFFEASLVGLFGPIVREPSGISRENFRKAFDSFDDAFPLLASGLIPRPLIKILLKKGKQGQHVLAEVMRKWIEAGFPGLETGVVKDMAQNALDQNLGTREAGKLLVADAWALQANAPYVPSQLLLCLLQGPETLLKGVVSEIDRSISLACESASSPHSMHHLSQHLPLLQSCITETLRTGTSVFSIRDVEQPLPLRARNQAEVVIPPKSRVICATRASHLDQVTWGEEAHKWDGRRFFDGDVEKVASLEESEKKSTRAREVWGFGGGISRCEGNQLATFELKSFISILLATFEFEIVAHSSSTLEDYETLSLAGTRDGLRPKRRPGRVGLGVFQLDKDMKVRIRRRPKN
ncbi:hypothetical protein JCM3765_006500 [Sporobolomyces pararoseus]